MKTIHKYRVGDLLLPVGAKVLTAGYQDEEFYIWAEVDTDEPYTEHRTFAVYGTGWEIDRETICYIDTVFVSRFVWHVYEVV